MAEPSGEALAYAQGIVSDFRRAVMEGWFGKNFEQPDTPPVAKSDRDPAPEAPARDIHGNDLDRGIDR